MAVANQYQMSMDSVLRQFGSMASEMAVLGAGGGSGSGVAPLAAFSSTAALSAGISNAFPAEWRNGGNVSSAIRVDHWGGPGTTISGNPNLMNRPEEWRTLTTRELRSSLLPRNQNFIGRSWGYQAGVAVTVNDNMSGIQTSWYRTAGTDNNVFITNRPRFLYSNTVTSFMVITEIPTQFSVQGQNLALTNRQQSLRTRIGRTGAGGQSSTILGRTVNLGGGAARGMNTSTKVVARGGIVNGGTWSDPGRLGTARQIAAQAEAGSSSTTSLDEAGSAVLVNVGTRGREIFRPPGDYANILASRSSGGGVPSVDRDFLKYWLPYYQCNFRLTVTLQNTNVRHRGAGAPIGREASISDITFVSPSDMRIPARRDREVTFTNLPGAPKGFGRTTNNAIQNTAQASLHALAGSGSERPVNVVMRAINTLGTPSASVTDWVDTVDIDLGWFVEKVRAMTPRPTSITAQDWTNMPIAIHIDIRGPGGAIFDRADQVPVVIRRARVLARPVSIVTPGTIYIQGKFGSDRAVGRPHPHPFSLFAPKLRFGMEGRQPGKVVIRGQRIGVGAGTNRHSDILSVEAGATGGGVTVVETQDANIHLSNINPPAAGSTRLAADLLPPVLLKDWIIETHSNF